MSIKKATFKTPASCGELLQGVINDSMVLVSCPVNLYNSVTVSINESGIIDCDPQLRKSKQAVEKTLHFLKLSGFGASIDVSNPISKSKGLGSSTSDVTSCIAATAQAVGKSISSPEIARIAADIEPSDATMFNEMVLFAHRSGYLINTLGKLPQMDVLAIDFGGTVDTVEYNSIDRFEAWKKHEKETAQALNAISQGIKTNDITLIGRGATINALTSHMIEPNANLDSVIDFSKVVNADGVSLAHSGTIISLLIDPTKKQMTYVLKQAQKQFYNSESITHFKSVQPGPIQII